MSPIQKKSYNNKPSYCKTEQTSKLHCFSFLLRLQNICCCETNNRRYLCYAHFTQQSTYILVRSLCTHNVGYHERPKCEINTG